jgi:hypothetical protein
MEKSPSSDLEQDLDGHMKTFIIHQSIQSLSSLNLCKISLVVFQYFSTLRSKNMDFIGSNL